MLPTFDSSQWKVKSTAGVGGRIGVLWSLKEFAGLEVGPSVGFYSGPSGDITVDGFSSIYGNGSIEEKIKTSFIRFLLEGKKYFLLII